MTKLLDELRGVVGDAALTGSVDVEERYLIDPWGDRGARPLAVVRPKTTSEVSRVLIIANAAGVPVVTQGGRTGLVGGCLPQAGELILSLERMNTVESIDVDAGTATVQAGVVLQALQTELEPSGLMFPLDLGARGSCTIGGNISTNAGGNRVIRYGMTRHLVRGLEVVLADGRVLNGLRPFIKDNTGLDLKQLFIGAEGILGVVTRATLQLIARPEQTSVALCALNTFEDVRKLLRHLRSQLGGDLTAFEGMWKSYYARAAKIAAGVAPINDSYNYYVLAEVSGSSEPAFAERFERVLQSALEQEILEDVVIAQSTQQTSRIWQMRDLAVEVDETLAPHISFDASLQIDHMEAFISDLEVAARDLDARVADFVVFGHVGDGNLHLTLHSPEGMRRSITDLFYGLVRQYGGSVSAEHGIGVSRLAYLGHTKSATEIAVMRALKATLDPRGILNPGRVLGL